MSIAAAQMNPMHQSARRWWAVAAGSVVYLLVLVEAYLQVGPYWMDRITGVWPVLLFALVGVAAYAAVMDFMSARRARALRGLEVVAAVVAALIGALWVGGAVALALFSDHDPFWLLSVAVALPVLPVATFWLLSWLLRRTAAVAAEPRLS